MIIECACGAVIRGGSEQQLLDAARLHIEIEHPGLGGAPPTQDLLAMAVDETPISAVDIASPTIGNTKGE